MLTRRTFTKLSAALLPAAWLGTKVGAREPKGITIGSDNIARLGGCPCPTVGPAAEPKSPSVIGRADFYHPTKSRLGHVDVQFARVSERWTIAKFGQWMHAGGAVGTLTIHGSGSSLSRVDLTDPHPHRS